MGEHNKIERELFRKYVADKDEAESEYAKAIKNYSDKKTKAKFVEMNHDTDSGKNKPCVSKEIKDGKVQE